mmetsp:Transcript_32228/g.90707  ORF Transcript_32228/g.90707 Transcript_32228/m.90707 type:complete len:128 (+) Transcript_32228:167-550(+)
MKLHRLGITSLPESIKGLSVMRENGGAASKCTCHHRTKGGKRAPAMAPQGRIDTLCPSTNLTRGKWDNSASSQTVDGVSGRVQDAADGVSGRGQGGRSHDGVAGRVQLLSAVLGRVQVIGATGAANS